jgi:hypothetical protein
VTPETDPATLKLVADATAGLPRETLAGLLDDIRSHLNRFIGFGSDHASIAVALWVAHCYVVAAAAIAAYLRIRSAAEESGKSTLLEVLHQLLRTLGINAVSVSPSVVYRLREKVGPVALLLDESDNGLAKRQDDSARDLLAIVNAGYRRSATVYRTEGAASSPARTSVSARPPSRGSGIWSPPRSRAASRSCFPGSNAAAWSGS